MKSTLISRGLISIALTLLLTDAQCAETVRKWCVTRKGRTVLLDGQFAGVCNGCVQLKLTTGVMISTYRIDEFSEKDVAYMREANHRRQVTLQQKQQVPTSAQNAVSDAPTINAVPAKADAPPETRNLPSWVKTAQTEEMEVSGEPTSDMIEAEYLRVAKKCGFEIRYNPTLPDGSVSGTPVSSEEIKPLLGKFFAAIDMFPVRFLKRTGLDTVVFCHDLKLSNIPAGGIAAGNVIYLSSSFGSHVVYHELFHVADPNRENSKWTRLNDKTFAYGGSPFAPLEGNRKEQKRSAASREDTNLRQDFTSNYAMSNEVEDRAETFACMVANPKAFAEQCKTSPVLSRKSELVKEIVRDYSPAMNKDFWVFIADSNDDSRMADFLKRSKLNDVRQRQKKSVINNGYKN